MTQKKVLALFWSDMPGNSYPSNNGSPVSPSGPPAFKPWKPGGLSGPGSAANDNLLTAANDNEIGRRPSFDRLVKEGRFVRLGKLIYWLPYLELGFLALQGRRGAGRMLRGLQQFGDCNPGIPPDGNYRILGFYGFTPPTSTGVCVVFSSQPAPSQPPYTGGFVYETWGYHGTTASGPRYSTCQKYVRLTPQPGDVQKNWQLYLQPDPFPWDYPLPRPGFPSTWPWPSPGAGGPEGWPREGNEGGEPTTPGKAQPGVSPAIVIGTAPSTDTNPNTNRDEWPKRRRPPKRTKERKVYARFGGTAIGRIVGGYTELMDFVNALWDALPREYRSKLPTSGSPKPKVKLKKDLEVVGIKKPGPSFFPVGLDVRVSITKMDDIYRNFNEIDLEKALKNLARNEAGDMVLGKASQKLRKSWRKAVDSGYAPGGPFGPQTGPAL